MTSCISLPDVARNVRPSADMTPVVTVFEYPRGLPMAIATWPTRTRDESPNSAYGSAEAGVVVQTRRDAVGALHDVTIGQQVAVGREQETRSAAVRWSPSRRARGAVLHFDESHGRRHALERADHGAGVGIEQRGIVFRRFLLNALHTGPARLEHRQLKMIFGAAARPSTMSLFTRRTKIAGSSRSPPSASIAWSYSTCASSENAASSTV